MKIETRNSITRFDVKVITDHTTITTDISESSKEGYVVPEKVIENFITVANEMSRFNRQSDLDFVKKIAHSFLNDSEIDLLIDCLTTE